MSDIRSLIAELVRRSGSRLSATAGRGNRIVEWGRPLYSAVVGWMAGDKGVEWSINGVNYRIDIHHRIRLAHEYEPPVAAFLSRLIRPGFICFDVGANVGAYVLQLCHWTGPSGRVVAFEPNPNARAALERHVTMNGFTQRVQIVAAAVGAAISEGIFHAAGVDGMSRLDKPNSTLEKGSQAIKVPIITLDNFVRAGGAVPDLILIDVEGFEAGVLEGAREVINSRRGAVHIVVEMHPSEWRAPNRSRREMEQLLNDLQLRPRCLTGQRDPLSEYGIVYLECA
jgi:FkbM family methyltransferase